MAWLYFKGKKRKILDILDNTSAPKGINNTTLYIEGDKKDTLYKVSAMRSSNVHEPIEVKKYNDKVFKARSIFIQQQNKRSIK